MSPVLRRLRSHLPLLHSSRQISSRESRGTGYVVLLPEVPPDTAATNPLLNPAEIPDFDKLSTQSWRNALVKLCLELEGRVWKVEEQVSQDPTTPPRLDDLNLALDTATVPLNYCWSLLKTMNIVKNDFIPSDGYLKLHERAQVARSKKFQSEILYNAWRDLSVPEASKALPSPQSRLISKYLTESHLSGTQLTGPAKSEFLNNTNKLRELMNKYRMNVAITTNMFKHMIIDPKFVADMPHEGLATLSKNETNAVRGPWVVKLTSPAYEYFMQYCPERALRWNTWQASVTRASGEGDKSTSNSVNIEEIRGVRHEQAKLLGYDNYADLSMVTKMAGNVENVKTMIASLFVVASPRQSEEIASLQSFAESRGFEHKLKLWDIPYWRRKQAKSEYNVDSALTAAYFPYPVVLSRLFAFVSEIFGIEIHREKQKAWHEDVEYYVVSDRNGVIGHFFIDPYARPGEKLPSAAWMLGNRSKYEPLGLSSLATLVYNFSQPMYGKPSLLTFADVHTLFEKFGHMLQHVLTTIPYPEVSGTTNIEWDATQVPAKFMSMWLGNKSFVSSLSSHYESGESMPDQMLGDLLRSQKHLAAYDLVHQLYLSDLDMELHSNNEFWLDTTKRLWSLYKSSAGLLLDKKDFHPCSFSTIFSGDYAAAYYSTLWSRMLAADVYKSFVTEGRERDHWKVDGIRFRSSFLSLGGAHHPSEVFRQFRGRDPSPEALLWSLGLRTNLVDKVEGNEEQERKQPQIKADSGAN